MSYSGALGAYHKDIEKLFSNTQKMDEFEIDFNMNKTDLSYDKYIDVMKYITHIKDAHKYDTQIETSLDINYSTMVDNKRINYRISLFGKKMIEKYVNLLNDRNNHVIFNTLLEIIKTHNKKEGKLDDIKIFRKVKEEKNTLDIPELNVRVRMSKEEPLTQSEINDFESLNEKAIRRIIFRLKQRLSVFIKNSSEYVLRIDLTTVKMSQTIKRISYQKKITYELELEYMPYNDKNKTNDKILDNIMQECQRLLKVIQQSNFLITKTHTEEVIDEYRRIMGIGDKIIYNIDGRQPVSLEIQHIDVIENKYAVLDKADGERYFMIICFNHVYLISQNLKIKDTGIQMRNSEYNNTILDCEYIYIPKYGRHAILIFDCLFAKGEDIRKNPVLMERIAIAQKIVDECFVGKKQNGFHMGKIKTGYSVEKLYEYYSKNIDEYFKAFKHDIEIDKQHPFIRVKFIIPVSGLSNNEIFKYSTIIWNKYLYGNGEYPYILDGIIYQPLNQSYITNARESKYADYKWKPTDKNTIDFYVRFEKDKDTNRILNVFDNSDDRFEMNKPYRICYLHSGKRTNDGEVPVYFRESDRLYIAHLFLNDGDVRDSNGDIIQDETVVEFSYNNSVEVNEKFRWIPIRTRYDKTEMVNKYGRKYGNSADIAERIWRSITVPVRYSDIDTLAKDSMYEKQRNDMIKKITKEMIVSVAKENVYYQEKTRLAEPMRNYHNWIKSILMYTYLGSQYHNKMRILDIGCGRGGDLMKFYHAKIESGVCIDIDYETLHNAFDGAISRYNGLRKKYPAYPKLTFACVDFTVPLNIESQMGIVQDKTMENRKIIDTIFPKTGMKQFDRLNIQFVFHYFLENEKSWDNVCDNINKCLREDGYMILTTFDAQRVIEVLGKGNNYTTYYTTNGDKKIFMDIVRKFPENKKTGLGMAIDVYNSLISNEGVYNTEYLVDKDFLVDELKRKCNMSLVDTMMFDQIFEINRDNITQIAKNIENEKTRSFLNNVASFYNQQNDFNAECFKITRLNRYYVFRKNEK